MGQAIPRQHPAVVLRSHYNALRALLALVLIVAAGLTATVVILATDDDSATSSATPNAATLAPPSGVVSPPVPASPPSEVLPQRKLDGATDVPQPRYDGGPEEGSSGLGGKDYSKSSATGDNSPAPASQSEPEFRRQPDTGTPFGGQRP